MPLGALTPITRWLITNNGLFSPGAKLYTYASGTSTPQPVYSDAALTTPHANPVVADSEGVLPVIFLSAVSYRFLVTDALGVTIFPVHDDIYDVAALSAAAGADATTLGTAGEALPAGSAVYLSAGDGARTAGRWYLTDADFQYASNAAAVVGMVPVLITSGTSGVIKLRGRMTGLSGRTAGATQYASATAGALTEAMPTNGRVMGQADSTTSIVLDPGPTTSAAAVDNRICDGRLTLSSGVAVPVTDVTAATNAYWTPFTGNRIALYDGTSQWVMRSFTELTIALTGFTASKPYDVFAYDNAGVVAIETLIWTNTTTRATAIVLQDGVYVKTGATTRRYLGTIYINSTGGQSDDTLAKRYVYSHDQAVDRPMRRLETTASWTYTIATYRQANAAAANQLEIMVGVARRRLAVSVFGNAEGATGSLIAVAVGEDSTSVVATGCLQHTPRLQGTSANYLCSAFLRNTPAIGLHTYTWLEWSTASGTTSWQGDTGEIQSGMIAEWAC